MVAQIVAVETDDNRQVGTESVAKIVVRWTSATGGTVSQSLGHVSGSIVGFETDPGAPAPTDNYDITLEDELGYDVLEGLGANRDTATTEKVELLKEVTLAGPRYYAAHPPVSDTLTFKVATAGDEKQGIFVLFVR